MASKPKQQSPVLSDNELRFLRAVIAEPGKPVRFYCHQTRINGKRLAVIRARLVELNYLREHEVALSVRGRTSIIIEPLPRAREAVQNHPEVMS